MIKIKRLNFPATIFPTIFPRLFPRDHISPRLLFPATNFPPFTQNMSINMLFMVSVVKGTQNTTVLKIRRNWSTTNYVITYLYDVQCYTSIVSINYHIGKYLYRAQL